MGLSCLLLIELLTLSMRLDDLNLVEHGRWVNYLVAFRPKIVGWFVPAVAAIVFFGRDWMSQEVGRLTGQRHSPVRWWICYVFHLAAFVCYAALLGPVSTGDQRFVLFEHAGTLLLIAVALTAVLTWLQLWMPLWLWPGLFWRGKWYILAGLVSGALAGLASWALGLLDPFFQPGLRWMLRQALALTGSRLGSSASSLPGSGIPDFWIDHIAGTWGFKCLGLLWVFLGVYWWVDRGRLKPGQVLGLGLAATLLMLLVNAVLMVVAIRSVISVKHSTGLLLFSHVAWPIFTLVTLGILSLANFKSGNGDRA